MLLLGDYCLCRREHGEIGTCDSDQLREFAVYFAVYIYAASVETCRFLTRRPLTASLLGGILQGGTRPAPKRNE
jgi:hypothetical protein